MARVERVGVIVPAAGGGRRLGASRSKALADLHARPILSWTLTAVEANDRVDEVVVVSRAEDLEAIAALVAADGLAKVSAIVPGGPSRRASVAAGLAALGGHLRHVAVHDACRPLLTSGAIDRLAAVLQRLGADGVDGVAPCAPVTDTVRWVAGGEQSGGLVDREQLRALQTPQVFRRAALERAHASAPPEADEVTDAVLLERAGLRVALVKGELENLAISSAFDLDVAEVLLSRAARGQPAR
jgi:2-C-methyl-D-erythritol 4-phosphate cytidylyltransferase